MKTIAHYASGPKFNWWVLYFFTFFYIFVEFAFNYQLLDLTVDLASEDILLGLEFWGRVMSGGWFKSRLVPLKYSLKGSEWLALCFVLNCGHCVDVECAKNTH